MATDWGPLRRQELLEEGEAGERWAAHDPRLRLDCELRLYPAAATPDPATVGQRLREARSLSRLNHPHAGRVLGAEEHGGRVGVWYEALEGPDFDPSATGPAEGADAARQVAEGLTAIHRRGVGHGGFGPGVLAVRPDGRVALRPRELLRWPARQRPAPGGAQPPDPREDLPALAALVRELAGDLVAAHPGLAATLDRCEAPDTVARPASARPVAEALRSALGLPAVHEDGGGEGPSEGPGGLMPLAVVGGTLLLVLLSALAVWRPWQGDGWKLEATLLQQGNGRATAVPAGDFPARDAALGLRLSLDRELYTYVVGEAEGGSRMLLHPLPDSELDHPLPSGGPYRLPGLRRGVERWWQPEELGGLELLALILSPKRVPQLERELRRANAPGEGVVTDALPLAPDTEVVLRGLGGVGGRPRVGGGPAAASSTSVWLEVPALPAGPVDASGLRVYRIELQPEAKGS